MQRQGSRVHGVCGGRWARLEDAGMEWGQWSSVAAEAMDRGCISKSGGRVTHERAASVIARNVLFSINSEEETHGAFGSCL